MTEPTPAKRSLPTMKLTAAHLDDLRQLVGNGAKVAVNLDGNGDIAKAHIFHAPTHKVLAHDPN